MSAVGIASWQMAKSGERSAAQRASGGPPMDEAAFERLYARTSRSLWTYLRRVAGDPAVADDVHQESYLRYLSHPCPAAGERPETAYLFRIANNLLRDRWRRERRERGWLEQVLGGASTSPTSERSRVTLAAGERVGLKLDVGDVLGELKPRQRALLWLAYVEGYDHREIAQILGLQPGSVRVLLHRARRRLAVLLRERGLEPENLDREV